MKKYNHPTDDFLRETFKDHQMAPADAVKQAFLRDVAQVPKSEKKGRRGFLLLTVLFVIVGTGILIWAVTANKFTSDPARQSKPLVEQSIGANQETGSVKSNKSNDNTPPSNASLTLPANSKQPLLPPPSKPKSQKALFEQPEIKQQPEETQSQSSPVNSAPLLVINENPAGVSSSDIPAIQSSILEEASAASTIIQITPRKPEVVSTPLMIRPDSIHLPVSRNTGTTPQSYHKQSPWIPSLGIYYTPEWMFNTLEGSKFINNFGLEGTFHFGRFSVRTGAGLSIAKGTNELVVEYNDFLGAYNKLDSMQFTWNDPTHQYIPKFYMTNQNVWDSLMKLDYARVVKRYTYLQIPMIMGYDFWQSDRISIGVRVGPVMSILLASKQLSGAYDPGEKRIVSINSIAPEQVSLNWQVMAGLHTSIRLTRELQFEIEPSIRYYFNSVYEKPVNNAKPWSIGIRAAFVVKF